jgi:mRNA-degrading endonuclease RelE of RelBE toxin-antitoxin system
MNFNVIVTSSFKKQAKRIGKKHHSLKADIVTLIDSLEQDPLQGEPLGKDCYKVRMAISNKGKGKSGGARIITCVKVVDQNVYLLSIYDKSDKETISDKELDKLLVIAGLLE